MTEGGSLAGEPPSMTSALAGASISQYEELIPVRSKTEEHPAMTHRCPFCGADPGTPCRAHRGRGHELRHPHSRRIRIDWPTPPKPPKPPQEALCCVCGQLRTVSVNYWFSYKDENHAGGFADDPRGWRQTGTLKCGACGQRTRHALLLPDGHGSHDEMYQQYALGGEWPGRREWAPDRERLREAYFKQFPRNPNLTHWYSHVEAAQARAAGQETMLVKCGDTMQVPPEHCDGKGRSAEPGLVKPNKMRDQEYEDAETGLSWVDMECVNCLKVVNAGRVERSRADLERLIRWYFVRSHLLTAAEVEELRTFLQDTAGRTWHRWQAERHRSEK